MRCSSYTSLEARRKLGEPTATAMKPRVAANSATPATMPAGIASAIETFGDRYTWFDTSAATPHAVRAGTLLVQIESVPTARSRHAKIWASPPSVMSR